MTSQPVTTAGGALFARYAFPPNELGYCGPGDAEALLHHESTGQRELARRARQFEGAWPYLEILATQLGLDDPLDARVVEAYWVGGDLLSDVDPRAVAAELRVRFRRQAGGTWTEAAAAVPHHGFHVFEVYPWVPLLRTRAAVALSVLDRCRIRWGTVLDVAGDRARVRSQPLTYDGQLALGPPQDESVRWAAGGSSLAGPVEVGDLVTLHWDWVCDRVDEAQLDALRSAADRQLVRSNDWLRRQPT